jgi:glucosamine--fructose-6-phosphate aminotransferase (isomerizing)
VSQGGVAEGLRSRTDTDPRLRGTKNTVAMERRVLVAIGRSDNRPIILVPESTQGVCKGILLLHARFKEFLDAPAMAVTLKGYHNRYTLIRDAVVESNGESWTDEVLARIPVLDLLTKPVVVLADQVAAVRA